LLTQGVKVEKKPAIRTRENYNPAIVMGREEMFSCEGSVHKMGGEKT